MYKRRAIAIWWVKEGAWFSYFFLYGKSPAAKGCDVHHLRNDASVNRFCRVEMCTDLHRWPCAHLRSWDFNGLGMKPISRAASGSRLGGTRDRQGGHQTSPSGGKPDPD